MLSIILKITKSGIFKRTAIYTASSSLNALVAFLLLPVLTRFLTPFDYGIVETFMAIVACLTGVVLIGGNTIISKEYFIIEESTRQEITGNILGMILLASSILLILVILSNTVFDFLSNILKISNNLIILAIVVSCGNAIIAMISNYFQLEKKAMNFLIFMNSKTLFEIFLSLFLIIVIGLKWDGRITGISASIIAFALIALYLFNNQNVHIQIKKKYVKQIIKFGAPLILSHIGGWVYGMVDKIMINNLISVEATGLYSVGYRFGMVIMMIETSFSLAWLPFFFENISQKRHENNLKVVKATYIYIASLILFSIFYSFFGKYLLYLMVDKRFFGADQFIFFISMAYCFDGIWKMFLGYIIFKGMMKTYSAITIGIAMIQVILNYMLIQYFGLIGAGLATCISMMIGALITISISVIIYPMPWFKFIKEGARS